MVPPSVKLLRMRRGVYALLVSPAASKPFLEELKQQATAASQSVNEAVRFIILNGVEQAESTVRKTETIGIIKAAHEQVLSSTMIEEPVDPDD